ncbi:MAG: phosphoribosylformylglycinamidine cyclo-ligase [Actinobacteria bacterium]|nr:MAG: phosphoribosylformylglycinamidine cyclo-ligase [Actinomycetota bacterium]
MSEGFTYAGAGVDIGAGEEAVERIKARVRSTFRPEVIGDIGGFGGLFAFPAERYRAPVLVASTDGVGTKALVARVTGRFSTIGIDLVAMCVDDVVCQGAEPLFFLDYTAVGRLDPGQVEQLVEGVAAGCRQAGCALIGGEMAEHPGAMEPGEFDLAGFAVGVAERDRLLTGAGIRAGDVLVGLLSPGLRCNGYSLARRILLEHARLPLDGPAYRGAAHSLADELLLPSVVYAPAVMALLGRVEVRALAHVTGGGIPGNLARVLSEIRRLGAVDDEEMARVFNLGVGMIAVVGPADEHRALDSLRSAGVGVARVGEVVPGRGQVRLVAAE